jgi:hypothetical protein
MDLSHFKIDSSGEGRKQIEKKDRLNDMSTAHRARVVLDETQASLTVREKELLGMSELTAMQLPFNDQYERICLIRFITGLNSVIDLHSNTIFIDTSNVKPYEPNKRNY